MAVDFFVRIFSLMKKNGRKNARGIGNCHRIKYENWNNRSGDDWLNNENLLQFPALQIFWVSGVNEANHFHSSYLCALTGSESSSMESSAWLPVQTYQQSNLKDACSAISTHLILYRAATTLPSAPLSSTPTDNHARTLFCKWFLISSTQLLLLRGFFLSYWAALCPCR